MTVREILGVVARRWYTSALAFALAGVLAFLMLQDGGIYATRTVIDFRWPGTGRIDPLNGYVDESIIAFAGLVVHEVNAGREPDRYATEEAPLYGAGRREADFVEVAFVGNQFTSAYPNAAIEVHVVGRDRESVAERQHILIDRVLQTSIRLQREQGASSAGLIEQEVQSLSTRIDFITPSRAGIIVGLTAMMIAAAITGAGVALVWEKAGSSHRHRARRGGRAHEAR